MKQKKPFWHCTRAIYRDIGQGDTPGRLFCDLRSTIVANATVVNATHVLALSRSDNSVIVYNPRDLNETKSGKKSVERIERLSLSTIVFLLSHIARERCYKIN